MLRQMVEKFGWDGLARDLPLTCFRVAPSLTSALKYLRKAPRARKKFEDLYETVITRRAPQEYAGRVRIAHSPAGASSAASNRPSRNRTRVSRIPSSRS